MKHTPGPWSWREFAATPDQIETMKAHGMEPSRSLTNEGQAYVMGLDEDGDGTRIALVDAHTKFKRGEAYKGLCEQRDANARLIAAAPDLLAAAKRMLHEVAPDRDLPATRALEAAIAKAERMT